MDLDLHVGEAVDERLQINHYDPDVSFSFSSDNMDDFEDAGISFDVDRDSGIWNTTYYLTVTGTVRDSMEFDYKVTMTQMDIENHNIYHVYLTGHVRFYWNVTFNANGGSIEGGSSTQTVQAVSGTPIQIPNVVRTDWTCTGWWTQQSGGHNWGAPGTNYDADADIILYAQWVEDTIPVTSVDLPSTATVQAGSQITLTARVYPSDADSKEIDWTIRSGDSRIAIVDTGDTGTGGTVTIRGDAQGTAIIRATAVGTNVYAECTITVSPEPTMYNYTLIYNTNGGNDGPNTFTTPSEKTEYSTQVSTKVPTRSGYTFLGWSTDMNAVGVDEVDFHGGDQITLKPGTTTLYAVWEQITTTWTLHFDANGGAGEPSDVTAPVAGTSYTFTIPSVSPKMDQKVFLGWARSPDSEVGTYQPGGQIVATSQNTTLYAVWGDIEAGNHFVLIFDTQGGRGGPTGWDQTLEQPTYSQTLPETVPTKAGYSFGGWAVRAGSSEAAYQPGDLITLYPGTTTLYAIWTSQGYTLILDSNGGSTENIEINETGDVGEITITIPSDHRPVRDGYYFMGWAKMVDDGSGGQRLDTDNIYAPGSSVNFSNGAGGTGPVITLYAVWQAESPDTEYKLVYDIGDDATNGPSTEIRTPSEGETPVFTVSDTIPKREGYTFLGWSDVEGSDNAVWTAGDQITAKGPVTTIFAVWVLGQDTWTVTFDANNGYGAPGMLSAVVSGTEYTFDIPEDEPERDDYEFQGWSLTPDGEVYVKAGGQMKVHEKETILYAVWELGVKVEFVLNFNANGGENAPDPIKAMDTGEHEFTIPDQVPTVEGAVFAGWAVTNGGEAIYQKGSTIIVNEVSTTLWATWEPIPEGGEVTFVLTYECGEDATNTPNQQTSSSNTSSAVFIITSMIPQREGYEFLGWSPVENGEALYMQDDQFAADSLNSVLWAVWKPLGISAPYGVIDIKIDGLTISYSAEGSINASTWSWDFGDGNSSGLESGEHTFDKPGTYVVVLKVHSDVGLSHTVKKTITVTDDGVSTILYVVIAIIAVIMVVVVLRYSGVF